MSSLYADGDLTRLTTTASAATKAYNAAGITAADVDVAEVHDCFAVTELMMIEAIGLAAPGQGAALTKSGATAIGGATPVNTGGGLIGFGHPVGATGVKQPLEIFRQMKGRCGDYQVGGDLRWGITANMGGDDKTVVSLALKNLKADPRDTLRYGESMRFVAIVFMVMVAGLASASEPESVDRQALVVAVPGPGGGVPPLVQAEAHALKLAEVLGAEAGFERVSTLVGNQISASDLVAGLEASIAATSDDGLLLVLLVARGAGGDFGDPALLTRGASVADPAATGLSIDALASALRPRTPRQSVVVMMDVAHADAVGGCAHRSIRLGLAKPSRMGLGGDVQGSGGREVLPVSCFRSLRMGSRAPQMPTSTVRSPSASWLSSSIPR